MSSDAHTPAGNDVAIRASNLSKHFRIYERPFHRLKEAFFLDRRAYHSVVQALSDVSFTVRRGESVGVMGHNGAGKTSLLSILAGTLAPTTGTVDVYGRVGAILALGVGFLTQYTGRENIRNGLIARGVPRHRLAAKEADVIEFAELGEAIDNPIRTYSSGMNMRLGFSLAISIDPDILIVDEALAVGDAAFQHKCQTAIRTFIQQGRTLFFVSHNTALLEAVCDRGIVLDKGRVVCDGHIKDAVRQYRLRYFGDDTVFSLPPAARAWGDPEVELVRVVAMGAKPLGSNLFEVHQGELVRLAVTVRTPRPIEQPGLGVVVRTTLGHEVCGSSSIYSREPFPRVAAGEFSFEVRVPFKVPPGMYEFEISIADMATQPPRLLHIWEETCTVRVLSAGYAIRGMVDPGIAFIYDSKVYSLSTAHERRREDTNDGPKNKS
jgi:lipopolysaccharide transport system ATP-binding protein